MSTQPGVVPAGCGQSVLREHEGLLLLAPTLLLDAGVLLPGALEPPAPPEDEATSDVAALLAPTDAEAEAPLVPEAPPVTLDVPVEVELPRDDVTPLVAGPLLALPLLTLALLVPPLPGRDVAVLDVAPVDVVPAEEAPLARPPLLVDPPVVTVTAHAPSTHWRPSLQSLSWEHRAAGSSCAHPDATDITTARQAAPRILGPS